MGQKLVILSTKPGCKFPRVRCEAFSISEAAELIASMARVTQPVAMNAINKLAIDSDEAVCSLNGTGYFIQHWSL